MIPVLLLTALLNVTDPSHDVAHADIIADMQIMGNPDAAVFDIEKLEILEGDTFSFALDLASFDNPWNLPYGFSFPIIEIYLNNHSSDGSDGIQGALLEGSGMQLADDEAWEYAFKITGDGLTVYRVVNQQAQDVSTTLEATLERQGGRLIVTTQLPVFEDYSIYGVLGSYDPFSTNGWRDISNYLPEGTNPQLAVFDIIASDAAIQTQALETYTLPRIYPATQDTNWIRFIVAGIGLIVTAILFQIIMTVRRRRQKSQAAQPVVASVMETQANLSKVSPHKHTPTQQPQPSTSAPTSTSTPTHPADNGTANKTTSSTSTSEAETADKAPILGRLGRKRSNTSSRDTAPRPRAKQAFGEYAQASFSGERLWVKENKGNVATKQNNDLAANTAAPAASTNTVIHQAEGTPSQSLRPKKKQKKKQQKAPTSEVAASAFEEGLESSPSTTPSTPQSVNSTQPVNNAQPSELQHSVEAVAASLKEDDNLNVVPSSSKTPKGKRILPKNTLRPRKNNPE